MHVLATKRFHREREKKLSTTQDQQLTKFISRLKNGTQRAKPLRGDWLYEIKIQEKRVYYVKYQDDILLVAVSSKKGQDTEIQNFEKRRKELFDAIKKRINTQ
jgi:hypothetical protein